MSLSSTSFVEWRFALLRFALLVAFVASLAFPQSSNDGEFFEKTIRPILVNKCATCHNPELKTAGLDLTTAQSFAEGGQSGPVVSYEDPAGSRLVRAVGYEDTLKMPPTGKLSEPEIMALTRWVEMRAPWPAAEPVAKPRVKQREQEFSEEDRSFWAFQPIEDPVPPKVRNEEWIQSPIDRFILFNLEQNDLKPSVPASKLALLRRATFDLTGLPPTEQEMAAFLTDDSSAAFERVVNRLLASPRYGERWGRHWLDLARYADSTGKDGDHRYPHAWRYRDYVIQAFNSDLPYNQFVREQIAGDLLPSNDPDEVNRKGIIATGFLALGPKALALQDKTRMLYDIYDEQLDVTAKVFMGLTLSCARCHDHKFDPLSTKDYYSLVSIFASTRSLEDPKPNVSELFFKPLVPEAEYQIYRRHQAKIAFKEFEIASIVDRERERFVEPFAGRLADYMLAARRVYEDGEDLSGIAGEKGLDEDVLCLWVDYLDSKGNTRPYLFAWYEAAPEAIALTAKEYQEGFQQRLANWNHSLAEWRRQVIRDWSSEHKPPSPRPDFMGAEDRFLRDVFLFGRGPFALPKDEEQRYSGESRELLAKFRKELEELKAAAPPQPDLACAIEEGEIVDQRVFIRGDHNNPGDSVQKGFPVILGGATNGPTGQGSGRLQLAEWITSPDHPLTARVMVNRLWQWHFGEGLVRTPDNFGAMGDRPTHPRLLDYLARRFIESGWSVKKMHRMMMLSSAYRMGSNMGQGTDSRDLQNRLLSHFPRRRLDAEEIRDALLMMDDSIDFEMGGSLMRGSGVDPVNSSNRMSLDPNSVHRRMVYLPLRRANIPSLLNLFDFGDAITPLGKRPETNVAPQALFMMNSGFVATRARNLADILLEQSSSNKQRVQRAYLRILNRRPTSEETDAGLTYVQSYLEKFADSPSRVDVWQSFCRVLIASNEFVYVD